MGVRIWSNHYLIGGRIALAGTLAVLVWRLFRTGGKIDKWVVAFTMSVALLSMHLGTGFIRQYSKWDYIGAAAESVFCGTSILIVNMILEHYIYARKNKHNEDSADYVGKERIRHYVNAFAELSRLFLNVPATQPVPIMAAEGSTAFDKIWNSRLAEQRVAVAQQLDEVSEIMSDAVKRAYNTREDTALEDKLRWQFRQKGIGLKKTYIYENENKRNEVYLTLKAKKKRCISMKEAAAILSKSLGRTMMPSKDCRAFIGREYQAECFVEKTNFRVLYAVEKRAGYMQQISGDSFSFFHKEEGKLICSMSDGMGSGLGAYHESEMVIDLLEQFLEAGFSKETSVRMINSALVLRSDAQTFSTIDIAGIDLYSGICEFLKIGASTSFIRRDHWVETITSTSLPAGVFWQMDLDKTVKKLYDGDMVIMVTDGVLDMLPIEHQEEIMKNIILEHPTNNPKELAGYIVERACQYQKGKKADDMTVLVMGIWKD